MTLRPAGIARHDGDVRSEQNADFDQPDRHVAEGKLVLTVIGNDGVRWACETCNETVYERDGEWSHFDKRRDPCQSNTDCWGTCDRHSPLRPDHRTLPGKTPTDGAS